MSEHTEEIRERLDSGEHDFDHTDVEMLLDEFVASRAEVEVLTLGNDLGSAKIAELRAEVKRLRAALVELQTEATEKILRASDDISHRDNQLAAADALAADVGPLHANCAGCETCRLLGQYVDMRSDAELCDASRKEKS